MNALTEATSTEVYNFMMDNNKLDIILDVSDRNYPVIKLILRFLERTNRDELTHCLVEISLLPDQKFATNKF